MEELPSLIYAHKSSILFGPVLKSVVRSFRFQVTQLFVMLLSKLSIQLLIQSSVHSVVRVADQRNCNSRERLVRLLNLSADFGGETNAK